MCWHWGFENVSNNIFFIFLESWLLAPIAIGNKNHCHFRYLMQLQNLLLSRFFSSCSEKRKEKENIHFPTAPKILLWYYLHPYMTCMGCTWTDEEATRYVPYCRGKALDILWPWGSECTKYYGEYRQMAIVSLSSGIVSKTCEYLQKGQVKIDTRSEHCGVQWKVALVVHWWAKYC